MKWLALLLLTVAASAQITVNGNVKLRGVAIHGTVSVPSGAPTPPQTWANDATCNPPGGVYDVTKTIPGDFAATWAGFNAAVAAWVAAADQWWLVKITHGTVITGNSAGVLLAKAVGAGLPTKCLVFESDTPLTVSQTACSHGIQDNLAISTDTGIRNPDCNGTGMSYQLGQTVTAIAPGAFTLANGTATNTSNYNDLAKMYTLESTTVNIDGVIQAGSVDVNGNGFSHIVIRDAEIRFTQACCTNVKTQTSPTVLANLPTAFGFDRVWVHGDATDAGAGTNAISNNVQIECGGNCWFTNSQISKSIRPGAEGHGVYWQAARGLLVAHNWIEGNSIGLFDGGIQSQVVTGSSGTDILIRRNRVTYPWAWMGHGTGGGSVCAGQSCVQKNRHEFKGCNRCVIDGNIFENSDNSGAQNGRVVGWNVRACSSGICDDYAQTIQNMVFSNNVVRHGCRGWESDPNSGTGGNGNSAAIPERNVWLIHSVIYDISIMNPGCDSVGSSGSLLFNSSGHTFAVSSVTRNSAGTITTIVLTGGTGENQTGLVAGDPISLSGCTDTTFNTAIDPPLTTALTVSGTTITYTNLGTANATSATCSFSNKYGWPLYVLFNHVTSIGGSDLVVAGSTATQLNAIFPRNQTYTNNLFAGSGGFNAPGGIEGTGFSTNWLDAATLTFHHNVFADRVATTWAALTAYKLGAMVQPTGSPSRFFRAITNGTSGAVQPVWNSVQWSCQPADGTVVWQEDSGKIGTSGGLPLYTQYSTIGVGTTPPTTLFFPMNDATYGAVPDGTSIGFSGALNAPQTGTFTCTAGAPVDNWNVALDLSDWHGYKLATTSAFHNAGSDSTDLGANIDAIENAQTSTQYQCAVPCNPGPNPE